MKITIRSKSNSNPKVGEILVRNEWFKLEMGLHGKEVQGAFNEIQKILLKRFNLKIFSNKRPTTKKILPEILKTYELNNVGKNALHRKNVKYLQHKR